MASGARTDDKPATFRIREKLVCLAGASPAVAACGEYELQSCTADRLHFCKCDSGECFSLSLDAMQQHLAEGRIKGAEDLTAAMRRRHDARPHTR